MSKRMIFFPQKRRTSLRRAWLVVAMMAVTAGIFLTGVQVGAQHADAISGTAPLLSVEFASIEQ